MLCAASLSAAPTASDQVCAGRDQGDVPAFAQHARFAEHEFLAFARTARGVAFVESEIDGTARRQDGLGGFGRLPHAGRHSDFRLGSARRIAISSVAECGHPELS